jgi:Tyrosyl-DNA phosphodiesterase
MCVCVSFSSFFSSFFVRACVFVCLCLCVYAYLTNLVYARFARGCDIVHYRPLSLARSRALSLSLSRSLTLPHPLTRMHTHSHRQQPSFPRDRFYELDYVDSARDQLISHGKLLLQTACKDAQSASGFLYFGSHNLSQSAWGDLSPFRSNCRCDQFEAGVVLLHVQDEPSTPGYALTSAQWRQLLAEFPLQRPLRSYTPATRAYTIQRT